ncbi:DUF4392 domain-containing protein [Lacimicrobium alkaliphilum]|uniref:D-glutamate cyclase-like C-terminal domain-containing protein n=1 Tax=Lacimicrobium alkaliphilum TaxID=1526571 RepID=A0ABQ1R116_9ALTE|nr:glutamate cyclase domain-containing protein [Lacimicrobium alkaliphilum]GGD51479.1 hypothetical protein GCM10011357_04240 [Lacimicrobium alkaliphilum]
MTNLQALSEKIEALLVQRNLRGMQPLRQHLKPGYLLRSAQLIANNSGTMIIGTGFPVTHTFETDGPVGAIALYQALERLEYQPYIACGKPLFGAIREDFRAIELSVNALEQARSETRQVLARLKPSLVLSIERPGLAENGRYHNMRGEDISERCACFDYFLIDAPCPTIGIGDGGNEIGMGNVFSALQKLDIVPARTECDELILADVSNWAAYGILALLGQIKQVDLLSTIKPLDILQYLSDKGSVDGVTRENTLTEDSLCFSAGEALIRQIQDIIN